MGTIVDTSKTVIDTMAAAGRSLFALGSRLASIQRASLLNVSSRNILPSASCQGSFVKNMSVAVTQPAPAFAQPAVVDGQFKDIKLDDFKGKYLVLFFYPLDFTFVCPTELIAFSDRIDEFKAIGAEVVGVSTDSKFSHLAWINTPRKEGGLGGLKYPLMADFNKVVSKDYGVLLEDAGIALRGLFIIDESGTVRSMTVNDLPVGRSVDETLRIIKAFQFVAKHGEVCPAGWTPGADTIDPANAGKYFSKQ